jgi:predicted DNA-binding WGR domain protein
MTPESLRVKLWREQNKKRYNDSQKALMKTRRAKKKEEKQLLNFTVVPYKP